MQKLRDTLARPIHLLNPFSSSNQTTPYTPTDNTKISSFPSDVTSQPPGASATANISPIRTNRVGDDGYSNIGSRGVSGTSAGFGPINDQGLTNIANRNAIGGSSVRDKRDDALNKWYEPDTENQSTIDKVKTFDRELNVKGVMKQAYLSALVYGSGLVFIEVGEIGREGETGTDILNTPIQRASRITKLRLIHRDRIAEYSPNNPDWERVKVRWGDGADIKYVWIHRTRTTDITNYGLDNLPRGESTLNIAYNILTSDEFLNLSFAEAARQHSAPIDSLGLPPNISPELFTFMREQAANLRPNDFFIYQMGTMEDGTGKVVPQDIAVNKIRDISAINPQPFGDWFNGREAAGVRMPQARLFGTTAGALTGAEWDFRAHISRVSANQTELIEPALFKIHQTARDTVSQQLPRNDIFGYDWNPIFERTKNEILEGTERNARALQMYGAAFSLLRSAGTIIPPTELVQDGDGLWGLHSTVNNSVNANVNTDIGCGHNHTDTDTPKKKNQSDEFDRVTESLIPELQDEIVKILLQWSEDAIEFTKELPGFNSQSNQEISDFVIDTSLLQDALLLYSADAFDLEATAMVEQLQKAEPNVAGVLVLSADPVVSELLLSNAIKLSGDVGSDIEIQVREALAEGQKEGEGAQLVQQRIREVFDANVYRATTIARTEIVRASVEADRRNYQANDVNLVEWSPFNPCPVCEAFSLDDPYGFGQGIYKTGDMGLIPGSTHPNCMCDWLPVTTDFGGSRT